MATYALVDTHIVCQSCPRSDHERNESLAFIEEIWDTWYNKATGMAPGSSGA